MSDEAKPGTVWSKDPPQIVAGVVVYALVSTPRKSWVVFRRTDDASNIEADDYEVMEITGGSSSSTFLWMQGKIDSIRWSVDLRSPEMTVVDRISFTTPEGAIAFVHSRAEYRSTEVDDLRFASWVDRSDEQFEGDKFDNWMATVFGGGE